LKYLYDFKGCANTPHKNHKAECDCLAAMAINKLKCAATWWHFMVRMGKLKLLLRHGSEIRESASPLENPLLNWRRGRTSNKLNTFFMCLKERKNNCLKTGIKVFDDCKCISKTICCSRIMAQAEKSCMHLWI